ncbi:hypothetical protein Q4543_17555 [Salipiger sp. 1_MG-2023]|nr:hypothetical protein [Salipiger sp. 1_MG-2023]
MQSLRIAEIPPVLLGGRLQDASVGHAQNSNKVKFNDRYFVYSKTLAYLPETHYPPRVYLRYIDADGLQDNGTLRNLFNGRNSINNGGNPVIDFSTGTWSAPLDSFVNSAVRWVGTVGSGGLTIGRRYRIVTAGDTDWVACGAEIGHGPNDHFIATSATSGTGTAGLIAYGGELVVGNWYEIRYIGSTDFTALGASANSIGERFQATATGTPLDSDNGVCDCLLGARHGDIAACSVTEDGTDYVQLYVNVYDYNNAGGNRLALLESTDGVNFTEVGEIQFDGGNFGSTVADVRQRGDRLYMVCGEDAGVGRGYQKALRYSDDRGRTWAEIGTILELSDDEASCRHYGMPVGRYLDETEDDDFIYMSVPASRISADWPEGNILIRRAVADLDEEGLWDVWPGGLVAMRGCQEGGLWNCDYFPAQEGFMWATTNVFAAFDFDDVNTDDMNTLRGTPYYRQDDFSFKHTGALRTTNLLALKDWDYWPFEDGDTIRLKHMGRFLSSGLTWGTNTYLTTDLDDPGINWIVERQAEFWMFKQAAAPTISLSTGGNGSYANRRAIGLPIEVRTQDASTATNNIEHHWQVLLHGDDSPTVCTLINRESSLALASNCSQRPALHGDTRQMWEIVST